MLSEEIVVAWSRLLVQLAEPLSGAIHSGVELSPVDLALPRYGQDHERVLGDLAIDRTPAAPPGARTQLPEALTGLPLHGASVRVRKLRSQGLELLNGMPAATFSSGAMRRLSPPPHPDASAPRTARPRRARPESPCCSGRACESRPWCVSSLRQRRHRCVRSTDPDNRRDARRRNNDQCEPESR
jgi:hypothetical protein